MKSPLGSIKLDEAAFEQANQKAIERARRTGTSIVIWQDGEVRRIDPNKIDIARKPRTKKRK